jgi:WD40 repeat protein
MGLNWLIMLLLLNTLLFDSDQFDGFLQRILIALLVMPFAFIILHAWDKGRIGPYRHAQDKGRIGPYRHAQDMLFFRLPNLPIQPIQATRRESIQIILAASLIIGISAVSLSIRPCHWLDLNTSISGCRAVLYIKGSAKDLRFSRDGQLLGSVSNDGIRVWDKSHDPPILMIPMAYGTQSMALSASAQLVVGSGSQTPMQLWNLNGRVAKQIPTEEGVASVAFSPDGAWLLTGMASKVVMWQVANTTQEWSMPTDGEVYTVAFSPDGQIVAVGTYNGEIAIRRSIDGQLIQKLAGPTVYHVAFSPDGTLLASECNPGRINVWRVGDGKRIWSFLANDDGGITGVAFSSDGSQLIGGSGKNEVSVWRTGDFERVAKIRFETGVRSIAAKPNSDMVAIGLWDNTVRLWELPN